MSKIDEEGYSYTWCWLRFIGCVVFESKYQGKL
jgi:hypothetical protein